MKFPIFISLLLIISCSVYGQKQAPVTNNKSVSIEEIHLTEEFSNYHKAVEEAAYTAVQIENYAELAPLMLEQIEEGVSYDVVGTKLNSKFPGAKKHLKSLEKQLEASKKLAEKSVFFDLTSVEQLAVRRKYLELNRNSDGK